MIHCHIDRPSRLQPLLDAVKARGSWIQMSEAIYLVSTEETAADLYGALVKFTDHDDSLYVVTVAHPYRGFGRRLVNQWLDQKLAGDARA